MKLSETMTDLLIRMLKKQREAEAGEAARDARAIGGLSDRERLLYKATQPNEFYAQGVRQFTAAAKLGLIEHQDRGFWTLTAKGLEVAAVLKSGDHLSHVRMMRRSRKSWHV